MMGNCRKGGSEGLSKFATGNHQYEDKFRVSSAGLDKGCMTLCGQFEVFIRQAIPFIAAGSGQFFGMIGEILMG
jgi:hypothetical protein